MDGYKGKEIIINVAESWGKTKYSISMDGRVMVGEDKAKWEAAVQQLRDAGAIIIDNRAPRDEVPGVRTR